jgi:DNA-binding Lrp family transcriptional regulator
MTDRSGMDIEAHRDLKLLEAVAADSRVTQRRLSSRLGIALGLTNVYLKRLVRKGYIKCVNVQSNRISYLITPRGIAEKARLTYEFMDYSLHLYGEVRQHLRGVLQECAAADRRVAIYGRGEAAELAYLSLKEFGLEPVAIFDGEGGKNFLGMPVRPLREHVDVSYDLMIVASLERSDRPQLALAAEGVAQEKLFPLRQEPGSARRAADGAKRNNGQPRER